MKNDLDRKFSTNSNQSKDYFELAFIGRYLNETFKILTYTSSCFVQN